MKALVIFAEHRFFGESMPFGSDSFKNENLVYLTVEQTMMDYAEFIKYIKANSTYNATEKPVIVFGGSYGGMLAAWLRMKYPHVF